MHLVRAPCRDTRARVSAAADARTPDESGQDIRTRADEALSRALLASGAASAYTFKHWRRAMDKIILDSAGVGWGYECLGLNGSRIFTNSQAEAHFWHSLGYVVLHYSHWAT
jgi:hypothetical protein